MKVYILQNCLSKKIHKDGRLEGNIKYFNNCYCVVSCCHTTLDIPIVFLATAVNTHYVEPLRGHFDPFLKGSFSLVFRFEDLREGALIFGTKDYSYTHFFLSLKKWCRFSMMFLCC